VLDTVFAVVAKQQKVVHFDLFIYLFVVRGRHRLSW